jgi:hypothetical protein
MMVCLENPSITEVVTIGGFVGSTPVGAANGKNRQFVLAEMLRRKKHSEQELS